MMIILNCDEKSDAMSNAHCVNKIQRYQYIVTVGCDVNATYMYMHDVWSWDLPDKLVHLVCSVERQFLPLSEVTEVIPMLV